MALTGNELDLYVKQYTDSIEHVLQQKGSRLEQLVTVEPGVMGERRYFNRIDAAPNPTEHTTRFAPIEPAQMNFERRAVTPITIQEAQWVDHFDLVRMGSTPIPEIVEAVAMSMARQRDRVILNALGGTALREVAGAASNATFDSNNTISVSTNTYVYDSTTGDTGLNEGKLTNAIKKLQEAHVDLSEGISVIASAKQLTELRTRMAKLGVARNDFVNKAGMTMRGADESVNGFLGLNYIHYEELADSAQLTSGDEYVYVFPKSAIKLGVWEPLRIDVSERTEYQGYPMRVYAMETLGAVRMDEAKVVRIVCNV